MSSAWRDRGARAIPQRHLLLGGVTLLAAIIRFSTLDLQSFHHDEAVTAGRVICSNLFDTLQVVGDSERSPPLYYLIAWLWSKPFGTGEVGLRSLSALVGTAMVPAGYLAGRELASRNVGLLTATFIALNPYLVWYSQEARSYILMALFATVALAFFARSLSAPTTRSLALWAASSALALCSHYFAVFLIIPEALLLLRAGVRKRRPHRAFAATAAVCIVGIALIPLASAQQGDDRRDGFTELSLAGRTAEVGMNYAASEEPDPLAGSPAVDTLQLVVALCGGTLFLSAVAMIRTRGSQRERHGGYLAAAVAVGGIGIPLLLALLGIDLFNPRNVAAVVVPILAIGAIGFGGVRAGKVGAAGAAATVGLFAAVGLAVNVSEQMHRENWRAAAEAMGSRASPRLIVAPRNGDDPLLYYLGAERFRGRRFNSGIRVNQIDVLSTTFSVNPPQGFELVRERGLAPTFVLWRFRSDGRHLVKPDDLVPNRVLSERDAALVDGID